MGVPQFFHWLVTHHESELLRDIYPDAKPAEYFFLDFNCGIHPAAKQEGIETLEDMYQAICQYLELLIKHVQPTKLIYIAIDGVAPMAKMRQQRFRRFKSIQDTREKDKIDRRFKCWKEQKFDFNMISPGTEFMNQLTIRLRQFIVGKWTSTKVILSDASSPREGEHKIMSYLRKEVPQDARVLIYGLDSDLIFLSLLQHRPKMCLFREKIFFQDQPEQKSEKEFTYLDISAMKRIVIESLSQHSLSTNPVDLLHQEFKKKGLITPVTSKDIKKSNNDSRLILDYVALSFILGNDFLPYLPSLKIKEGGLDRVMECYAQVRANAKSDMYLVDSSTFQFSYPFLLSLLQEISEYELSDFEEHREASLLRQQKFKGSFRYRQADAYQKALLEFEYVENKTPDQLKLGKPGWKARYYQYYLGDPSQFTTPMIKNYLEGLVWMLKYYTGDCPSWTWQYRFRVAPAASCLLDFLKKNPTFLSETRFEPSEPVSTEQQLLMILPPQSNKLLPEAVRKLMTDVDSPIIHLYPTDFKLDLEGHRYRWECYPILPNGHQALIYPSTNYKETTTKFD